MLKKAALPIIAALVMYLLVYQNQTLREDLSTVQATATAKQHRIDDLIAKTQRAKEEQRRLSELLTSNRAAANKQQHQLETLINENATLKMWANRPLPAGLDRLQRPAITGHAAFSEYLSHRHTLQPERINAEQPP